MQTLVHAQKDIGASIILVGHDMGLMAQFAHVVGVRYAGRLVEIAPVREIFANPRHPYTRMLIASLPSFATRKVFRGIPGVAPSIVNPPSGCGFHPRCPRAEDRCSREEPAEDVLSSGQLLGAEAGGWVPVGPSALPQLPGEPPPAELSLAAMAEIREAFVLAARRAHRMGIEAVELHAAHGYLLHEFLSPIANQRSDAYGGSFDNRTRFVLELFAAVRQAFDGVLGLRPQGLRCSSFRPTAVLLRKPFQ